METPFYPEGGGQVGDAGEILWRPGGQDCIVRDTQDGHARSLIIHFGEVDPGKRSSLGDTVDWVSWMRYGGRTPPETTRQHTC